jgi:hypothetical protein
MQAGVNDKKFTCVKNVAYPTENSWNKQATLVRRLAFGQHFMTSRGMQLRGWDTEAGWRSGGIRAWGIRRLRMTEDEYVELKAQLERLRQEHRDLDAAIEALQAVPGADAIQVQRLKKRRLGLRDRITFIEDQLTPDIIA